MKTISKVVRDQPVLKARLVVWETTTVTAYAGMKKAQELPTAGSQYGHGVDMVKAEETFENILPRHQAISRVHWLQ